MDEFDFIVVGGGSAGCVAAARLSEDPNNRVALIGERSKGYGSVHPYSGHFFQGSGKRGGCPSLYVRAGQGFERNAPRSCRKAM